MLGAIPNPQKRLQVERPLEEVKLALSDLPKFYNKYRLTTANPVINQYTFEAYEFLSLGVYIDIECFAVNDSRSEIMVTVRRKVGAFDQRHEISQANQHLATMSAQIGELLRFDAATRAGHLAQMQAQRQAQQATKKKSKVSPALWVGAGIVLIACFVLSRQGGDANANKKKGNTVMVAGMEMEVIPGLTGADITINFKNAGFKTDKAINANDVVYSASMKDREGNEYLVAASGANPTKLVTVSGDFLSNSKRQMRANAPAFLGYVATTPYTGANPVAAKDWALRHALDGGDTTIAGVKFHINAGSDGNRSIVISK